MEPSVPSVLHEAQKPTHPQDSHLSEAFPDPFSYYFPLPIPSGCPRFINYPSSAPCSPPHLTHHFDIAWHLWQMACIVATVNGHLQCIPALCSVTLHLLLSKLWVYLFPGLLNVSWPCDLLCLIGCSRNDLVPVPSLHLNRLAQLLLFFWISISAMQTS